MEKRYTAKVPASLTQRLYEAGMPLKVNTDYEVNKFTNKVDKKLDIEPPSYAKTLDWLASKGFIISVYPFSRWNHGVQDFCSPNYDVRIYHEKTREEIFPPLMDDIFYSWQEAAVYGIEKAIEML